MSIPTQHCAVICMELQRGIVGDLSSIAPLCEAVREQEVIAHTAAVLTAARERGIPVLHCTAEFRADRRGSGTNAPMLEKMAALPGHIECGSEAAQVVPELGPAPEDFVISRLHGVSPFIGTSLDITLRHLGVETVLLAGVSVNLGVLGLAIEAVNLGYRVIVLDDAVAGFPASYVADVKRYTLRHIARLHPCGEIIESWRTG